jgi:NAD(P)-dependent dehydrogenase (short-subunit alcohol dehydrogenase family)
MGYNYLVDSALIVGLESGIGSRISSFLKGEGWDIFQTSRRIHPGYEATNLYFCDLTQRDSISEMVRDFTEDCPEWNLVVLSIGALSPIGKFNQVDFEAWEQSIQINFINQVFLIREILKSTKVIPGRNRTFLTFAGSGTNSAPINFSAYTLSKIALIKSMELLAAEYPDFAFVSLGTGWMNTPIHNQTIEAGSLAGDAYFETLRRISDQEFGDPVLLDKFIKWLSNQPRAFVTGRNFALQGDRWQEPDFLKSTLNSTDSFKLRRHS